MPEKRVPAKTESRNVQRQHTRNIITRDGPREILINRGNVKDKRIGIKKKQPVRAIRKRPKPELKLRPRESQLPARKRWSEVFKIDAGRVKRSIRQEIAEAIEKNDIELDEGERIAYRVLSLEPNMLTPYTAIMRIINDKGEQENLNIMISGTPKTKKFEEFLNAYKDKMLIFKEGSFDHPMPIGYGYSQAGEPGSGIIAGLKDIEYVRIFKNTKIKFSPSKPRPHRGYQMPDGRYAVIQVDKNGEPTRIMRIFKDPQDAQDSIYRTVNSAADIFGTPWESQISLKDIKDSSKEPPAELFQKFRDQVGAVFEGKLLRQGRLSDDRIYELQEGRLDYPYVIAVLKIRADGLMSWDTELGEAFKKKKDAFAYLKELKRQFQ